MAPNTKRCASQIGAAVQILSLQRSINEGLEAVADEIISIARTAKVGLVVVDGYSGVRGVGSDPQELRSFLDRVAGALGALGHLDHRHQRGQPA